MNRALLVVLPLVVALVAVWSTNLPWPAALAVGALTGSILTAAVSRSVARDLTRVAARVNRWVASGRRERVPVADRAGWRELEVAINALGAAWDELASRLDGEQRTRHAAVAAFPDPAFVFGGDGYLVHANDAARSIFGSPPTGGTAGQALGSVQLARAVEEARELRRPVEVEVTSGDRDLAVLATPLGNEVLVLVTDRSERRRVDALRRDFVANASHELKTPVAGIQALSEALSVTLERDPERARTLAERLAGEADRLGKLVHHLIDLRRLEDRSEGTVSPVDLAAVVRAVIEQQARRAGRRGVRIDRELPDELKMVGIEDDLRLIVANLVSNAIAYNRPGGTVEVRLRRVGGAAELEVADTGIGIARQDLDRIFERFYRVDVARSRATGGTGLGLSIVRHAVDRQGGTVRVDSVLGEGSTFTVTLPLEPAG